MAHETEPTVEYTVPELPNEADRQQWREDAAFALKTQRSRFAPAPGCTVKVARRVVRAGAELTTADVGGVKQMRRLVASGVVLEQPVAQLERILATPADARFRVARRALVTRCGVLDAGEPISASDLEGGQSALDELVANGLVTRTHTESEARHGQV